MRGPVVSLDAVDACKLAEVLELLHRWLQADDDVAASLACFCALDVAALSADLSRFAFLLGGDGGHLVGEA